VFRSSEDRAKIVQGLRKAGLKWYETILAGSYGAPKFIKAINSFR
jgi:hypothetical protein